MQQIELKREVGFVLIIKKDKTFESKSAQHTPSTRTHVYAARILAAQFLDINHSASNKLGTQPSHATIM